MRAGRVIFSFLSFLFLLPLRASSYIDPNDPSRFDNPISLPQTGDIIQAGSTYNITWTPNRGHIVSIELWTNSSLTGIGNGTNCDVSDFAPNCTALFANMTNKGWYLWNVPKDMPSSDEYYFDIYVPNPGPEGPFYYITGNFSVHNDTPPVTTTSGTGVATSTVLPSGNGTPDKPVKGLIVDTAPQDTSSSKGMSSGAIGGLVGGIIGGIIVLCFVAVYLQAYFDRKRMEKLKAAQTVDTSRVGRVRLDGESFVETLKGDDKQWGYELKEKDRLPKWQAPVEEDVPGGRIRYPDLDDDIMRPGR